MRILGIDSSAKTASVAIVENGRVLALNFSNTGYTHSVTLLPMVQRALEVTGLSPEDIGAFAVSAGPGSFTGVRIGVAAVKGMAQPHGTPCVGVSTLEAAAYPLRGFDCLAVSVMDARCEQVYTARFACHNGTATRLSPDEALSLTALREQIQDAVQPVILVGDGALLCYEAFRDVFPVRVAPEELRYQRADSVALLAEEKIKNGEAVSPFELCPVYLRDSQAQQSLKKRKDGSQ